MRRMRLIEAEERLFGLAHPEAGAQLAQHWDLPDELEACIRFHHAPRYASDKHREMVSLIHVADVLSRAYRNDTGAPEVNLDESASSLADIGLSDNQAWEIFATVPKPDAAESLWSPR